MCDGKHKLSQLFNPFQSILILFWVFFLALPGFKASIRATAFKNFDLEGVINNHVTFVTFGKNFYHSGQLAH